MKTKIFEFFGRFIMIIVWGIALIIAVVFMFIISPFNILEDM